MLKEAIMALIVMILLAGTLIYFIGVYNGLIRLKNQIDNAFAQIDVQLKRRHDLIPNLVESAKMYLGHEKSTLMAVMQARQGAQNAQSAYHSKPSDANLQNLAKQETALSKALGSLYAVAEDYPELKADRLIQQLMDELSNTENRIGFARQHYNDSIMFYNNKREEFPNNLISGFFNFQPKSQLDFMDHAIIAHAPKVGNLNKHAIN